MTVMKLICVSMATFDCSQLVWSSKILGRGDSEDGVGARSDGAVIPFANLLWDNFLICIASFFFNVKMHLFWDEERVYYKNIFS